MRESEIQTIIEFLGTPHDRSIFQAFFDLCYRYAFAYLSFLKARGFRIPHDHQYGRDSIDSMTYDILGAFLQSSEQQPFFIIFNHFKDNVHFKYGEKELSEFGDRFKSLLFGFIRQELSRIKMEIDPQAGNLRRRVKDILSGPEYHTFYDTKSQIEYIALSGAQSQDGDRPLIPYEKLMRLVDRAYYKSKNRREWCRAVFTMLDSMPEFSPQVGKHELISSMVDANNKYLEIEGLGVSGTPDTDYQYLANSADKAQRRTIEWLQQEFLTKYIKNGRLSRENAPKHTLAAERYLSDLVYSSEVESLAEYFRDVMPLSEHSRYTSDYKYLFERTLRSACADYRERIRNLSTNSAIGD